MYRGIIILGRRGGAELCFVTADVGTDRDAKHRGLPLPP